MTVHITGLGGHLPGASITNQALGDRLGMDPDWIEVFLGNRARHFTTDLDTGEVMETLSDIATVAARRALTDARIDADSLDFVILATATPDELMPATVNTVARRLGLTGLPTFQIQSGCTGALQALMLAHTLIISERFSRGLVIGADSSANFFGPDFHTDRLRNDELVNYMMFGDGAGAAVLDHAPGERRWRLAHVAYELTGEDHPPGQVVRWRGSRADARALLMEDYKAIETIVPRMSVALSDELHAHLALDGQAPDWYLPPQLSGRMTAMISERLGYPSERCINCVDWTGNNGNALPFLQLRELAARFEPGQRAILLAIESSRWLRAGLVITHMGGALQ